jgi:hypothetical protein
MSSKYKIETLRFFDPDTKKYGSNFNNLASEISISESIDFPGIRATISITDSVGLYTQIKGNEFLELVFTLPDLDQSKSYFFKVYRVGPIIRLEKRAKYNIECISQESMMNELSYVLGSFKGKKVSDIVTSLLSDSTNYMQVEGSKKLFIEETKDKFQCVIPGWRVYDTINWLGSKAIRSNSKDAAYPQSGFVFYENYDGFHFKSFDKIIEDALNFKEYEDKNKNPIRWLKYRYYPKKITNDSVDVGVIESITYPDVFDHVAPIRNGSFAGLYSSIALDVIPNSKISTPKNKQMPYEGKQFNVELLYDKQNHLGTKNPYGKTKNPVYYKPKRNRLKPNQIHSWDIPNKEVKLESGAVTQRAEETAIYTHCRKVTFEAIKLQIRVAGNVTFHVGNPITIEIPKLIADEGKVEMDDIYTGVYIIAGVRHKIGGDVVHSELILVKDSLGSASPKA